MDDGFRVGSEPPPSENWLCWPARSGFEAEPVVVNIGTGKSVQQRTVRPWAVGTRPILTAPVRFKLCESGWTRLSNISGPSATDASRFGPQSQVHLDTHNQQALISVKTHLAKVKFLAANSWQILTPKANQHGCHITDVFSVPLLR
ncbi:hypothetical protein LX36DRAFT_298431 [Colletotrichum falcatum]|nr:hypothetical protein LX36DRAFT_298431 [Colletotrichum falcatum]